MNEIAPSVHPDLARHQASMQPRIYTLMGSIHCAYAYSVVNCTLIEGEESCILVDTMTGMDNAEVVAAEFRKLTDKPIRTVVYTHFHADHVSGAAAFVSPEDVAAGKVDIVGQRDLVDHVLFRRLSEVGFAGLFRVL
ncbi:MAG: MBL fold metallo-hydrolase, partial [Defluviicoccus sp.]|nr:MBL fold metallo-hydrolase [Defluviicoccus sp.]MDE0277946.1 MBL fold metallo-hydrolase [Defluviicoccus sp.]